MKRKKKKNYIEWAFNSNMEILQRFQKKFRINASWYVTNDTLHRDLNVPYIRDEIKRLNQSYNKMEKHPNVLATNLMKEVKTRRLKRKLPQDYT